MKIRISDIAAMANVSSSTVSLVLRGKPGASFETIKRIQKIAQEAGYTIQGKTEEAHSKNKELTFAKIIKHGSILNSDHFLFVNDYIDGIIAQARQYGYGVIVDSFDLRNLSLSQILTKLHNYGSAGILILATELNPFDLKQFQALSVPFVFLDAYYDYLPYPFFDMNNTDSLFLIIEYLKRKGHQKIAICSSTCESANYQRRRSDFETCIKMFDLEPYSFDAFCVKKGKETEYQEITAALKKMRKNLPTAMFCISDALALTVLKACKELDISIPSELSLIGFDNLEIDGLVSPRLTSVDVPKRAIAQEATASLIHMIESKELICPKKVLLSGSIIFRDSVANLKKTR